MLKKFKLVTRFLRDEARKLKTRYFTTLVAKKRKKQRKSIDTTNIKKVALLRCDGKLGDAIMMCNFIRLIEENDPSVELTLFSSNDLIDEWIKKISSKVNIINCDHKKKLNPTFFRKYSGYFDVAIELRHKIDLKDIQVIHYLNAKINIGYVENDVFDILVPKEYINIKERQTKAASIVLNKTLEPIKIPSPTIENTFELIESKKMSIAFNLFGANEYRSFTFESAENLIKNWLSEWPEEKIILIPVPGKIEFLSKLEENFPHGSVFLPKQSPSLDLTLSILSQCDLCFTPDTSVVHMASSLNTPTLAVFRDSRTNYQGWKPLSDNSRTIFYKEMANDIDKGYVYDFKWPELVNMKNEIKACLSKTPETTQHY